MSEPRNIKRSVLRNAIAKDHRFLSANLRQSFRNFNKNPKHHPMINIGGLRETTIQKLCETHDLHVING